MTSPSKALLVGVSGVSSSGKTTLARLLRDVLPNSFILHEDDFYRPDDEIPITDGLQDWDCIDAINLPHMRDTLTYIRANGILPPDFESKEDQNSVGECGVGPSFIESIRRQFEPFCREHWNRPIALIDGFLLYSEGMRDIRKLFDVKVFLRTSYRTAKQRREARSGYVTLQGFWKDPPGYVDKIVWPNYVKDHSFLFKNGDVEGEFDEQVCKTLVIDPVPPEAEEDMSLCLQWACETIKAHIELRTR